MTFGDDGAISISAALAEQEIAALALDPSMRVRAVAAGHRAYLKWHREHLFQNA